MMRKLSLFLFLLTGWTATAFSQVTDNFSDGNFTAAPTWAGSTADFIVNPTFQLQSNNTTANSTFYVSTASALSTQAQWEFYVNLKFATSGSNYVDAYLTASASDLTAASTTGYIVRIGNTADEICLVRKDVATPAGVKIIDGADGIVNSTSNNLIKIKVTRNAANVFTLYRDMTGTGSSYTSEGTVTDATYTTSAFFGFLVRQSTASFFQKHYFDDIDVKAFVPDVTAPVVQSATVTSANTVDVLFNEALDPISSQVTANYVANNGLGSPATIAIDGTNNALVHLSYAGNFVSARAYTLTVSGVNDVAGNTLTNGTITFTYFAPYVPGQYDVVIDEIMADPDPSVGTISSSREWVELRNTTAVPINLAGWKLADASGISGGMPSFVLQPDSFVILCTSTAVPDLQQFGRVISVTSFPSLSNDGEQLYLYSNTNKLIHAVNYSSAWYQNSIKANGGWTLEMIDTRNPCSGISNWTASTDPNGGTPGKINSVDAVNADQAAPKVARAFAPNATTVIVYFNEPLDSTTAVNAAGYSISDGIGVAVSASASGPDFNIVTLTLGTPLAADKIYIVTATTITDCVGNAIGSSNTAKVGLGNAPAPFDIVVNEILFNPPPSGVDYVELYNRSNKLINLKDLYLANRSTTTGQPSSQVQITTQDYVLFPGEFVVLTSSPDIVKAAYVAQNPDAFITIASMPSFNDDKGSVILMDVNQTFIDEIAYTEKWHFALIDNREGVALERIDYNNFTVDNPSTAKNEQADNWHSAATSVGYGTPTYRNSQFRVNDGVQGEVKITPDIVSPDSDGQDDFATIDYKFPEPGYVANITIFDASGRKVRFLQQNALCGISGSFRWDGLGDKAQQLPVGVYVIFTEVFNLKGKTKQFKTPIVLARRS